VIDVLLIIQKRLLLPKPRVNKRPGESVSSSKKILLVDDSATSRLMHRILISQKTGYEVVCAKDGAEALQVIASESPDLILMDVMMPVMDGLEVCRRIRQNERTRGVPVILLTFKTAPDSVKIGFESGCNEYLKKPVEESQLLHVLRSYLARN
jgi:CheY-like chemotaxis protein